MSKSIVYELLTRRINSSSKQQYNKIGKETLNFPCFENPKKSNYFNLVFKFNLEEGFIRAARAEIFAEPFFTAGCLWCVWAIKGKTLTEANLSLSILELAKDFGFIPKYYYDLVFPKVIELAIKTLND